MNKPMSSYLGQYLRNLREERGFESSQEYARHYKLPVSYVYYTEIESGKKKISLETAKELCESLNADFVSFYYHVLKDILPDEIKDDFLSVVPLDKTTDREELANKASSIRQAYQRNQLSKLNSAIGSMSEEAEAFFKQHPNLYSLVSTIYCVSSTTDVELKKVMDAHNISNSLDEILEKFQELGLVKVSGEKPRIIERVYDIITTNDQRIIAGIISERTEEIIAQDPNTSAAFTNSPSCFFGIVGITKAQQDELRALLADLDAEYDSYHLKDSNSEPQLMMAVFSPACEYRL